MNTNLIGVEKVKLKMVANDKVPELTNGVFDDFIKNKDNKPVLVDFFADWCTPCIMMSPIIDELSEKFKGKINFGKVNVDENSQLAGKFNIRSIPNFILFKDGKPVEQFIGSMSLEDFQDKLKKFV